MRIRTAAMLLLLTAGVAGAAPQMGQPSSRLVLPDGSIVPLPPGMQGFGPDGPEIAPQDPDGPAPHADIPPAGDRPPSGDRPSSADKPATPPSVAERRKQHLDDLYDRLAKAKDATEAGTLGMMIAQTFLRSGSDTADLLLNRAVMAMDAKDYGTASDLLDKVIVLQPGWAEAWNKRATVRYLTDDDVGSMADISQVLALEPRHFGALNGMGLILHRNGEDKNALIVFRRAAAINPQDPQVKSLIDQLSVEVEGSAL